MTLLRRSIIGAVAVLGGLAAQGAMAGTWTMSPNPAQLPSAGGSVNVTFSFTGDGVSDNGDLDLRLSNATGLTLSAPTPLNSGSCQITGGGTGVRSTTRDGGGTPFPATPTAFCQVTITAAAGAATGNRGWVSPPFLIDCAAPSGTQPCTFDYVGATGDEIQVVAVSAPTTTFSPAPPGPIAFGPGGAGTTSAPINVTVDGTGGTAGTSTSVSCAFSPAAPGLAVSGGPFTINNGDPAGDVDGTFAVTCSYAAGSPRSGTLACTSTPTVGGPTTTNYNVTCPAGGATPPSIAYNPNFGSTIQFNGPAGPVTQNIAVTQTAAGQTGTSVVVGSPNCTLTGAGAGAFTVSGTPITFTGGQANAGGNIGVTCTVGAVANTATLTCPETTNDGVTTGTVQRTWTLQCNAPSPEIVTTPPSGTGVNLSAAPSTTASATIGLQNTGFAPLTVTGCTITGAGAASFQAPVVSGGGTIAPGGTGTISLACTTPGAGGQSVAASLSCTTNDTDEGTITFPLACTALLLSIPTLGLMGKGLMALLVLSLGLIGFGLHRRLA
jgi:hypothetical protein